MSVLYRNARCVLEAKNSTEFSNFIWRKLNVQRVCVSECSGYLHVLYQQNFSWKRQSDVRNSVISFIFRALLILLTVMVFVTMSTNIVSGGCSCEAPGTFIGCFSSCEEDFDCSSCQGNLEGCQCSGWCHQCLVCRKIGTWCKIYCCLMEDESVV